MNTLTPRRIHPVAASPAQPRPPAASVPPHATALICALMEAMAGRRPLHQLRPRLDERSFHRLVAYVGAGAFRGARVGSIWTQMPTAESVEASARLWCASRWLTCAIRLDGSEGGWVCTELFVLAPARMAA